MKQALLIGGPKDGDWVDIGAERYKINFPRPIELSLTFDPDAPPLPVGPEMDTYYLEPHAINVMGGHADLVFGFYSELRYMPEKAQKLINALFQRDIAKEFKGFW